jgi:hypothetical protein
LRLNFNCKRHFAIKIPLVAQDKSHVINLSQKTKGIV